MFSSSKSVIPISGKMSDNERYGDNVYLVEVVSSLIAVLSWGNH